MSAAAFAKGLLDLETPKGVSNEAAALTPILSALVLKDAKMLDFITQEVEDDIRDAKQKLYTVMTEGHGTHRGNKLLDGAVSSCSELEPEQAEIDPASHALSDLHISPEAARGPSHTYAHNPLYPTAFSAWRCKDSDECDV